jgi:hypothetical protein
MPVASARLQLAWRDWLWLISGRRRSVRKVALGVITLALLLHSFAWLVLHRNPNLSGPPDKRMLVLMSGAWRWRWSRSQCRSQSGHIQCCGSAPVGLI